MVVMSDFVSYLPDLLAVSVDLYISFKTAQLVMWLWTNQLPPNRRLLQLDGNRIPMDLKIPAIPLQKPEFAWTAMIDKNLVYFPENYNLRGEPVDKYKDVYEQIRQKKPELLTNSTLPTPDNFNPPDGTLGFRIGCIDQPVYKSCVRIDYLRPSNIDAISYTTGDSDLSVLNPFTLPTISSFDDFKNYVATLPGGKQSIDDAITRMNLSKQLGK